MALETTDLLVAYRPSEQKHYKVTAGLVSQQTLDEVLTQGNVSDKSIELTDGKDLIHLTPSENRLLITGSALSNTPRIMLANYDDSISTDNEFTLQLGDSSTKAEFTSSANITHYDFKFNSNSTVHSFFSNGDVSFTGQAELLGGVKFGDGTVQTTAGSGIPDGTEEGQVLQWDGSDWIAGTIDGGIYA